MTTHFPTPFCSDAREEDSKRHIDEDARRDAVQVPTESLLTSAMRRLRLERKWTIRKLSETSGISINALWRMENGGTPMLGKAFQLASAFHLTIYEIWDIPAPATSTPAYVALLPDRMKVRACRNARGWRLNNFARSTGIPASTLSQIERGAIPNLKNAVRIAVALGASVDELWGGCGCESHPQPKS